MANKHILGTKRTWPVASPDRFMNNEHTTATLRSDPSRHLARHESCYCRGCHPGAALAPGSKSGGRAVVGQTGPFSRWRAAVARLSSVEIKRAETLRDSPCWGLASSPEPVSSLQSSAAVAECRSGGSLSRQHGLAPETE